VLADIRSLTPGVAELDDAQSLISLTLYANEFEIEVLIATSNLWHGNRRQDRARLSGLGVVDGLSPRGVEDHGEIQRRRDFLRQIGHK
jgi:adenosine/AMP kinase